jgi:hypothetical protein
MNVGWHILGNDRRFARHKNEKEGEKARRLATKSVAYAGFRRWPKTYREVLDRLHRNSDLRRSRSLRVRARTYQGLYEWLNESKDPSYDTLRAELKKHFLACAPVDRHTEIFGQRASDSVFVSLGYANLECGLRVRSQELYPWLCHLGIVKEKILSAAALKIPRRCLPTLKGWVNDAIMFNEAKKLLGIGRRLMESLINELDFYDLSTPFDGKKRWVFRSQVDRFWLSVVGSAPTTFKTAPTGSVSIFTTAFHKEYGGGISQVISGIRSGRIQVVGLLEGRIGLRGLLVSKAAVRHIATRRSPHTIFSFKRAVKYLRVRREAISAMVKDEFLEGISPAAGGRGELTLKAIKAFKAEYISWRTAARLAGASSGNIVKRLRLKGVEPTICRAHSYFYRRSRKLSAILATISEADADCRMSRASRPKLSARSRRAVRSQTLMIDGE